MSFYHTWNNQIIHLDSSLSSRYLKTRVPGVSVSQQFGGCRYYLYRPPTILITEALDIRTQSSRQRLTAGGSDLKQLRNLGPTQTSFVTSHDLHFLGRNRLWRPVVFSTVMLIHGPYWWADTTGKRCLNPQLLHGYPLRKANENPWERMCEERHHSTI